MQIRLSLFLVSFFILVTMPAFSGAVSDASGLCCAKNTLQQSTEKKCEKDKGKFYSVKESAKAQKECRSQSSAAPPRAIIPTKSEVPAFCCVNGAVKKATQEQCSKMKGNYYRSSIQAKQGCKPKKIFCCVDGKVGKTSPAECKKRKGTAYTSAAEAKKKCKPADVYCCVDGKIKKSSPQQCKQHKGTAYKSAAEAKRKCKPADVYCCVDGIVRKTSSKQCKSKKATAYKKKIDADKACREARSSRNTQLLQSVTAVTKNQPGQVRFGKTPVSSASSYGYCCADDAVSRQSQKECKKKKGVFSKSRISAEKVCRAQKTTAFAGTEKSGANNPLLPSMAAVTAIQARQARGMNSEVGEIPGLDRPDVDDIASVAQMETCKVSGWVAINGQAPTIPVGLQLTPTGSSAEGRAPRSFRLPLDGSFSIDVVPGAYRLKPLFSTAPGQEEQMSIPSNEFMCQPEWSREISSTFNWPESFSDNTTPPSLCVLAGAVNYETGTDVSEILGVTVLGTATGMEKVAVFDPASASYRVEIPAGSSYTVKAEVQEGSRLSSGVTNFSIDREQTEHRVNFTVERREFSCVVGGTVLVDGRAPVETLRMELETVGGGDWGVFKKTFDLNPTGMFMFSVPVGNYLLQPSFPAGSVYGETIPANQFICDPSWSEQITTDFNHTSPPECVLTGKVTNNGHWDGRIESLTLQSYGEDRAARESREVPVTSSGFRIVVPSGVPYTLIPNVPEGLPQPEMKFFTIAPEQRSHTVNFDLDNAEFYFGQLKVIGFDPNHSEPMQGLLDPGPVQFSIETTTRGGDGGSYTRTVQISSPENPEVNLTKECAFSTNGSCNFELSLYSGFNRQTDSIRAVMVDYEGEANSGRTWRNPFQSVEGDLKLHALQLKGTTGDRRVFFSVRNVGIGVSNPCRITVRVNEEASRVFSIPSLPNAKVHEIEFSPRGRPTEEAVFHSQIMNSCDPLTHNNQHSQEFGTFWEEMSIRGVFESMF